MMAWWTSKVKQGLNWGCDNSPPLNKNLVPRFKTWGKKIEGTRNWHSLHDPLSSSKMLIHCIILILTSFLSRASSNYDDGREGNSTGLIFSKIELYKINSRNAMLKHLELRHKTHREGWKNKRWGLIWWATIPRLDNMVHGFQSSEELIAMTP